MATFAGSAWLGALNFRWVSWKFTWAKNGRLPLRSSQRSESNGFPSPWKFQSVLPVPEKPKESGILRRLAGK